MHIYEKLTQNALFRGLDEMEVRGLLEEISYTRRRFRSNGTIACEGDPVDGLMLVLSGRVRGEMIGHSGKVLKIEYIESRHALAAAFVFGEQQRFPANIVADCDTECVFLRKQALLRLVSVNGTVLHNFLDIISTQAQFLSDKIHLLAFQDIKGKIAAYLCKELKDVPAGEKNIHLKHSHTELSELFGVTRPALSRALRQMHRDGILAVVGPHILVRDPHALEKMRE
jgi:CRP-like cAMP-binding protein